MIALTDAFSLFSVAVAVSAGFGSTLRSVALKNAWIFTLFVATLVPIPGTGMPLAGYLRGFIGELSITLLALSLWSLSSRFFGISPLAKRELTALLLAVAAAALVLYPTALGWGDWDAYRLGWGSWWLLAALLVLSAASAWIGLRLLPLLVGLALLAWSAGLMESGNLWDYLIDPWLSAFALGVVFIKCAQSLFKRFINRSSH